MHADTHTQERDTFWILRYVRDLGMIGQFHDSLGDNGHGRVQSKTVPVIIFQDKVGFANFGIALSNILPQALHGVW